MAENELGVDVRARLDKFRADMAAIPGIGEKEAKALAAQLSKELKAVERASRDAAQQSRRTKTDVLDLGKAAGDAGGALGKMAGAADLANPALGSMARAGADVFDVFEVMGAGGATLAASLGALAVIAAEVGAVYYVLTANARENARISAEVAEAHAALTPITDALRDATIDLDEATGALTETQAANARASIAAWEQLQAATENTRTRLAELAKEQGSVWTQMVDGVESIVPAWTPMGAAIRAVTTDSADLQAETDALNGVLAEAREKTAALVDTEHKATEAKAAHKAGTDALKASLDRLNEAMAKEVQTAEASADAYRGALAALQEQEDAARQATATKAEAIEADRLAAIASAEAERDKALAVSASVEARETVEAQYLATRRALDLKAAEERQKLADDETKAEAEAAAKRVEIAQREADAKRDALINASAAVVSAAMSYADSELAYRQDTIAKLEAAMAQGEDTMTSAQLAALEARIAGQKEAAMEAWDVTQGLRYAEAGVNAIAAVVQAMGSAPYPYNIPLSIAAGAAAGIEVAAIANADPPEFHSGRVGGLSPDEISATLTKQESVVTGQGTDILGRENIQRANAGLPVDVGQEIVLNYKHKAWRAIDRDRTRMPGPMRDALTRDDRVGLRGRGRR